MITNCLSCKELIYRATFIFRNPFIDRSKKSEITLNQLQECQKYVWILKVRVAILATWKLLNTFGTQKSSNFISFGEVRRNFKWLQIYSQKITISFTNNLLPIHRIMSNHSNLLISLLIPFSIFLIFRYNYQTAMNITKNILQTIILYTILQISMH